MLNSISHHLYKSQSIPIIEKYKNKIGANIFKAVNFTIPAHPSSIIGAFINSKKHSQLFLLYLQFICFGKQNNNSIALQWIEQNLRAKALYQVSKQDIKLQIKKYQVLGSEQLESRSFLGVFIHRKYNLNIDSYKVNSTTANHTSFQMKKSLRSEAIREYQKVIRSFKKDSMEELYGKKFNDILAETKIVRYLYRMKVDLQMKKTCKGAKEQILGIKGPTQHLLQIQSFFNPVSNMEEFFLTDVDYILEGNHFLKEKI